MFFEWRDTENPAIVREFKHDGYGRRQTAKITSDCSILLSLSLNESHKNGNVSLTIHSPYKYFLFYCTESWRETAKVSFLPFAVNVMLNLSFIGYKTGDFEAMTPWTGPEIMQSSYLSQYCKRDYPRNAALENGTPCLKISLEIKTTL